MNFACRILMIICLAFYATSTIAHAASTTAMDMEMSMTSAGDIDMSDCKDCIGDENGTKLSCDVDCTFSAPAILSVVSKLQPVALHKRVTFVCPGIVGYARPPEPFPPRAIHFM